MGTPSPTQLAKLAIGANDPVDFALNYADFDPGVRVELGDFNRTKGTYDKDGNLVVPTRVRVEPRYSGNPTLAELNKLLEWGMGGTVTGTTTKTYELGDVLAQRYIHFAPKYGETWFLSGCACDAFTLSCASGDGLTASLDLVGMGYNAAHAAMPALTLDQTTKPFVMSQLVLTYAGTARNSRSFNFSVRHMIDRDRILNSLTVTDIVKGDQSVTVGIDIPSGDNPATWYTGVAGAALLAVFTNADGKAFSITLPDVRFGPNSPVHPAKAEGYLTLSGECYRVGSGRPATVTLVQ